MQVGDKVTKDLVMRVENPVGTIINITKEYVVVKWDNINGQWHYTFAQTEKLEVVSEGG